MGALVVEACLALSRGCAVRDQSARHLRGCVRTGLDPAAVYTFDASLLFWRAVCPHFFRAADRARAQRGPPRAVLAVAGGASRGRNSGAAHDACARGGLPLTVSAVVIKGRDALATRLSGAPASARALRTEAPTVRTVADVIRAQRHDAGASINTNTRACVTETVRAAWEGGREG